jgi:hypothetical protein
MFFRILLNHGLRRLLTPTRVESKFPRDVDYLFQPWIIFEDVQLKCILTGRKEFPTFTYEDPLYEI